MKGQRKINSVKEIAIIYNYRWWCNQWRWQT